MSPAELVVLGAGSILPRAGYGCSGYALLPDGAAGEALLLDCGPGSVRALGGAGIALERVTRVLVSHFHPDHCLDLAALLFARRNPALAQAPPLELVGPEGLARLVAGFRGIFGRWVEDGATRVREVRPDAARGSALERDGLALTWAPTGHSPEALAWRVDLAGASLAYTGDTPPSPRVAELARGVDLLVAECSFPDELGVPSHLTPTSAGELAREAGCRRLLLTHFYPETDPAEAARTAARAFDGPIELAHDGSRHALTV